MKALRKPRLFFLAAWLLTMFSGYWGSYETALGAGGDTCGVCYYCAQYYQIQNAVGNYLGWTLKANGFDDWQGFIGQGCGAERNLWYVNASCFEVGCNGNTNDTLGQWKYDNADVCEVPDPSPGDIFESSSGVNPQFQINIPQVACGSGS